VYHVDQTKKSNGSLYRFGAQLAPFLGGGQIAECGEFSDTNLRLINE
jgi:hypothetical protein